MSRGMKIVLVAVGVFAAAQVVRPAQTNPPVDPGRTFQARVGASQVGEVLERACRDCHSNRTVWRWYTNIAPVSWLMARGVSEGRSAVNFSEWAAYSPDQQRALLALSCQDVSQGRMPGPYALLRPETRLSPRDIETICAAAR